MFTSEINHILFELRERPGDWVISANNLTLDHKPTGLKIWMGLLKGREGLYHPVEAKFCWLDRRRFRKAVRSWREQERKRRIANAFDIAELQRGRQPHQINAAL